MHFSFLIIFALNERNKNQNKNKTLRFLHSSRCVPCLNWQHNIVFICIIGVNHFCAVFYILILTMDSGSHGCSVTHSSSMADQAPRRKLSTSLAVTCIESRFKRHAIQALHTLKQLTLHLTTSVVMSPQ